MDSTLLGLWVFYVIPNGMNCYGNVWITPYSYRANFSGTKETFFLLLKNLKSNPFTFKVTKVRKWWDIYNMFCSQYLVFTYIAFSFGRSDLRKCWCYKVLTCISYINNLVFTRVVSDEPLSTSPGSERYRLSVLHRDAFSNTDSFVRADQTLMGWFLFQVL